MPSALPTRLLDLTDPTNIKLLDMNSPNNFESPQIAKALNVSQYAALSHCWGGSATYVLNCDTYETLVRGLPQHKLPSTFRDAIFVARRLGIQYLWIDSLCIFQDSRADWERESGQMSRTYRGAFLTISALNARSSDDGFLKPRAIPICPLPDGGGVWPGIILQKDTETAGATKKEPLSKRGWALQERVLSTRILHFGKEQMFWECKSLEASEHAPTSHDPISDIWKVPIREQKDVDTEYSQSCYFFWREMVQELSVRQLTYRLDKLPCLSGVAQEISRRTKGAYRAGIWLEDMPKQLLWFVREASPTRRSDGEYIAPTWSWPNVDAEVCFEKDMIFRVLCKFDCVVSLTSSADPFGRVSSGWMRVTGPLATISAYIDGLPKCHSSGSPQGSKRKNCSEKPAWDWIDERMRFESKSSRREIRCLGLVEWKIARVIGALIIAETGKGKDQYQRLGYCSICPLH